VSTRTAEGRSGAIVRARAAPTRPRRQRTGPAWQRYGSRSVHALIVASPEPFTPNGRSVMTESDKRIDMLADRAKEAANRVHASTSKTKEKLESQVLEARAAADKTRQELQANAADSRDEASQRWSEIRQEWRDHIAKIQKKIDAEKQESRADRAEFRAEVAEYDALAAIDFAYLAIEDAEWAALDAGLARMKADELAAAHA
jgi:hypothetical protein